MDTEDHQIDSTKEIDVIPEFGSCQTEVLESSIPVTVAKEETKAQDFKPLNHGALSGVSKKAQRKQAFVETQMTDKDKELAQDLNLANLDQAAIRKLIKEGKVCFKCRTRAPNY